MLFIILNNYLEVSQNWGPKVRWRAGEPKEKQLDKSSGKSMHEVRSNP